ncbi:putative lipase ROG1 [Cyberlindnera fabianii]|uniref:Putative lipase ROG1 n=1 Tax=Cyberlindnera fabianii TaxID=36022 RepID=A0A1V2L219_CYBFA|nr:putative lipase ROG1 [Cyberlindnera fabianii]
MTDIVYRSRRALKVGQLERYVISYEPLADEALAAVAGGHSLWLRVRNVEPLPFRAAFLRGPFIIYCDVRSAEYDHHKATFVTADQPQYEPNLSPGQSFYAELPMHTIKTRYVWIVDVISQIIFSSATDVGFELMIARSRDALNVKDFEKLGSFDSRLTVNRRDTMDLWNLPQHVPGKRTHLVVLTHGLHSNTGADMFYLKEQLDSIAEKTGEDLIVRGFHGNACKTEKGIKYLGSKLAEHIVDELYNEDIAQISFIGHSLGGLIQTFAIAYLEINFPWFFQKVQPTNFITIASPLLGIVTDNPVYVKAALSFGIVGRTGQDLGLEADGGEEPLLKVLPTGPTHKILKRFKNRTLYANAVNDGIVPLYTSALLYLDWKGLDTVMKTQKRRGSSTVTQDQAGDKTGVIPNKIDEDIITKTTKSVMGPLQKAMALLAPNAQTNEGNDEAGVISDDGKKFFPKTSMIESAASILLPPLPPTKFINDPESREPVIVHDRVYTEEDIPQRTIRKKTFMQSLDPIAPFEDIEAEIAREWHKGMTWRKVLVNLQPDAHNNIIVRRRFANAFGWPVVDHLVENHFSEIYTDSELTVPVADGDNVSEDEHLDEMRSIMDRDSIRRDNAKLDLKEDEMAIDMKSHWVNQVREESLFDVGATGMLTNINDLFDTFKNWGMNAAGMTDEAAEMTLDRTLKTDDLGDGFNV